MKKLLLSLFVFVFSSVVVLADDNSKEKGKVASKYRLFTYDIFGGLMYNPSVTYDSGATKDSTKDEVTGRMESLSIFAGVDVYAGGYYDKIVKRYREYLMTPMIGIQFDYGLKHSPKTKMDTFKLNNQFNLLFRLGILFKLKFDTNAKLYFLLGMSKIDADVGNKFAIVRFSPSDEIMNLIRNGDNNPIKKHSFIKATLGFGLDFVIKQHFLIGFEYRFTPLSEEEKILEHRVIVVWPNGERHPDWFANQLDINLHHFAIKAGFSF